MQKFAVIFLAALACVALAEDAEVNDDLATAESSYKHAGHVAYKPVHQYGGHGLGYAGGLMGYSSGYGHAGVGHVGYGYAGVGHVGYGNAGYGHAGPHGYKNAGHVNSGYGPAAAPYKFAYGYTAGGHHGGNYGHHDGY